MWYNVKNRMPYDGDPVLIEYKDAEGNLQYGTAKTENGVWKGIDDDITITRFSYPPKQDHVETVEEFLQKRTPMKLTVGQLRKYIQELPDDMPVLYQRIEDSHFENPTSGWTTVNVLWESGKIADGGNGRNYHYPDQYTECISAFSCYVHEGVLVIHAHY